MRRTQILARLIIFALFGTNFPLLTFAADGTPKREGDPSIAAPILAKTRELKPDSYGHLLTRQNLSGMPGAYGTEAHLSTLQSVPVKLVLSAWTPKGTYAQEFYVDNNEIVLVYETFSQFAGEPKTGWRNFMGYGGWERRIYLLNGSIRFVETFGEGAPEADASQLKDKFSKLVSAVCRESTTPDFKCR